jgi:dCTP deaminase
MILSDYDIKNMIDSKRLIIKPLRDDSIRENGVDFRLNSEVGRHNNLGKEFVVDPSDAEHVKTLYRIEKDVKEIILESKEHVLLTTHEYVELPSDIVGFVELRSSWARHGLSMPPTIIDAGFKGTVTLEVVNHAPYRLKLRPQQRFAHIVFIKTNSNVMSNYKGFYQGQSGIKVPQILPVDKVK